MLKQRHLWLILIIILALTISLYFIYNGKNKSSVQKEEVIEETEEDIVVQEAPVKIEKGTVVGIKQGKKEWEIEADKISLGED